MKQTLSQRILVALIACALTSCSAPMGADRVTRNQAYRDISGSILSTAELSSETRFQLHRYGLDQLLDTDPDAALRKLQAKAIATGDRALLFALAETSYSVAERQVARDRLLPDARLKTRIEPPERDPQDYYLSAAVYAYLFLFAKPDNDMPTEFDRRFRTACDLYNFSLGWALTEPHSAGSAVHLDPGVRHLPGGDLDLAFTMQAPAWQADMFDTFLMADQYRVYGLSARNRQSGMGAPLIAVPHPDPSLLLSRAVPATAFLRINGTLAELAAGTASGGLELYSTARTNSVMVGEVKVPLEVDSSISMAYTLNQASVWSTGRVQFLSAHKALKNQLILPGTYQPGLIPVVLVHGTFSSPVWWMEMLNTLAADPVLRQHYQFWTYLYSSSNPIVVSGADFRDELTETIQRLDPTGTDEALKHMVIIGHSQGGLLTKLTATDTGDKLWRSICDRPLDDLHLSAEEDADIRRLFEIKPLPFVKRVVFISTPHRGSFQSGTFARRIGHWFISLPSKVVDKTNALLSRAGGESKIPEFLEGNMPTSLDGMSPNNPIMLTLAEIPLAPGILGNSIVAVDGSFPDTASGDDGVVTYASAHVEYVESELIVRRGHSCQDKPETIEEVRRILHQHLANFSKADTPAK